MNILETLEELQNMPPENFRDYCKNLVNSAIEKIENTSDEDLDGLRKKIIKNGAVVLTIPFLKSKIESLLNG